MTKNPEEGEAKKTGQLHSAHPQHPHGHKNDDGIVIGSATNRTGVDSIGIGGASATHERERGIMGVGGSMGAHDPNLDMTSGGAYDKSAPAGAFDSTALGGVGGHHHHHQGVGGDGNVNAGYDGGLGGLPTGPPSERREFGETQRREL